jgi:ubiquinone/menaquinone biosynthesis C-methylase UbiE
MDVKIALECSSKSKDIAYNFDSILGYNTTFGHFKMSTISAKMIKLADITSKDNILEIGAGTGELTLQYSSATYSTVATDINLHMIEVIQQKAKDGNVLYALADARKLPFKDNSFNVVLERNLPLIYGEEFILDRTAVKVLNEMKRVSNNRVVIVHQNNSPLQRKENDVHLFEEKEIKAILENDLGLSNVKTVNAIFQTQALYDLLGEAFSRKIEEICENNLLLKRFSGCLIACGTKTE